MCSNGSACVAKLDCPPMFPKGVQDALSSAVATDTQRNMGVAWLGDVNHLVAMKFNPFSRVFDSNGGVLEKDFRIDVADRAATENVDMARTDRTGRFVYSWRDNREGDGKYRAYVRVMPK